MVQSIPEMHKYLEEMNAFFGQSTTQFISTINSHPGQFTRGDAEEFKEVIEDIRHYAMDKISDFFNHKSSTKCELYDSQVAF